MNIPSNVYYKLINTVETLEREIDPIKNNKVRSALQGEIKNVMNDTGCCIGIEHYCNALKDTGVITERRCSVLVKNYNDLSLVLEDLRCLKR